MGIYIKGMKKPKSCDQCPISLWALPKDCYLEVEACPITDVNTPHGRLIDADAEYKALSEMKVEGEIFVTAVEFAKIEMEQAQTVIEAEVE